MEIKLTLNHGIDRSICINNIKKWCFAHAFFVNDNLICLVHVNINIQAISFPPQNS